MLFQLAAKGDAPQWLVVVNKRRVPVRGILAGAAFGYAAIGAEMLLPDAVFNFLVDASGAIALVNYLLVAVAELRLRRQWERSGQAPLPIRMWLFPYLTWAVIAVMVAVLVAMAVTPALRSQFYSSGASVLLVLGAFLLRRRHGGALSGAKQGRTSF